MALAIAVLVTPWRTLLLEGGAVDHVFNGTDTHADALLLGCAVALLRIRAPSAIGWVGTGGIVVTGAVWASGGMGMLLFLPVATIASVMALAGCPAMLGWRPLAYVGRISYGLYLWHYLFLWWGWPAPLVIAVSIVGAVVSYERLERPFLRLKDRYARAPMDEIRLPNVDLLPPLAEPNASL
jgi:peptidoglycan/LPS O-acetylase OafA/YrhL